MMVQWQPFLVNAPLDKAKLCKPIEAYSSIAIAGLSYFIACTATSGGHHAFACLTRAFEIEEWFSRLALKVVALLHVSRQNLGFSALEVTPMAINTKAAYHLTAPGMHVQWGYRRYYFKKNTVRQSTDMWRMAIYKWFTCLFCAGM